MQQNIFVNLYVRLQHLTMMVLLGPNKEDLRFLLPTYNNSNSHLTSLFIEDITESQLTTLQTFMYDVVFKKSIRAKINLFV
jgi:hypothetical protein